MSAPNSAARKGYADVTFAVQAGEAVSKNRERAGCSPQNIENRRALFPFGSWVLAGLVSGQGAETGLFQQIRFLLNSTQPPPQQQP